MLPYTISVASQTSIINFNPPLYYPTIHLTTYENPATVQIATGEIYDFVKPQIDYYTRLHDEIEPQKTFILLHVFC